jgi:hypothetical protein
MIGMPQLRAQRRVVARAIVGVEEQKGARIRIA